jgi:hypothetical protein
MHPQSHSDPSTLTTPASSATTGLRPPLFNIRLALWRCEGFFRQSWISNSHLQTPLVLSLPILHLLGLLVHRRDHRTRHRRLTIAAHAHPFKQSCLRTFLSSHLQLNLQFAFMFGRFERFGTAFERSQNTLTNLCLKIYSISCSRSTAFNTLSTYYPNRVRTGCVYIPLTTPHCAFGKLLQLSVYCD